MMNSTITKYLYICIVCAFKIEILNSKTGLRIGKKTYILLMRSFILTHFKLNSIYLSIYLSAQRLLVADRKKQILVQW